MQMVERVPHHPSKAHIIGKNNKNTEKFFILSKSVHDFRETNSLFICNMVTHKARKVLCEKVQVDATVRDSNL